MTEQVDGPFIERQLFDALMERGCAASDRCGWLNIDHVHSHVATRLMESLTKCFFNVAEVVVRTDLHEAKQTRRQEHVRGHDLRALALAERDGECYASSVKTRPFILLTNDDGFRAEGINTLREALLSWADVIVVAPEHEQSGASHALSISRPLRVRLARDGVWAVEGTPADCVYYALHAEGVLPRRPDMAVSGMNHGPNLGIDVFYSGTVGGAREAALRGIPAIAASTDLSTNRVAAAQLVSEVAKRMIEVAPNSGSHAHAIVSPTWLFNMNIPAGEGPWAVRSTILGARLYEESVSSIADPRGRKYIFIGGTPVSHQLVPGSDTEAWDDGVASLTPLALELTATNRMPDAQAIARGIETKLFDAVWAQNAQRVRQRKPPAPKRLHVAGQSLRLRHRWWCLRSIKASVLRSRDR